MTPQIEYPVDHPSGHGAGPEVEPTPRGFWTSKAGLVTIAFLLIAGFFLLSEHRAHALGFLPFLLLLACPLLHMFMHDGHGGHGGHVHRKEAAPGAQNGSTRGKEHDHG
jgi:hypothetical protein